MRITNGNGARVIFDPVVGPTFSKLILALANEGIVYIYGNLSESDTQIPVLEFYPKMVSIKGYGLYSITLNDARRPCEWGPVHASLVRSCCSDSSTTSFIPQLASFLTLLSWTDEISRRRGTLLSVRTNRRSAPLGCLFLFWLGYVGTVMECFSRLRLSRRFPEKPNERIGVDKKRPWYCVDRY
jgi:hypothetical protein